MLLQRTNSISPQDKRPKSEAAAASAPSHVDRPSEVNNGTNGRRPSSPTSLGSNPEAKKMKKEEVRSFFIRQCFAFSDAKEMKRKR